MSGEKRFFEGDDHVKLYKTARPQVPTLIVEKIVDYLKKHRDGPYDLAVDVACGSGQSTFVLAEGGNFKQIVGIDVSPGQIREANERSDKPDNVEFKVSSAEEMPFADNSVDVIYINMAIHWFNRDNFFPEAKRILKPGGVLAISMFLNAGAESPSPVDLAAPQRERFDTAQDKFIQEIMPYFDKGIDLYMKEYKPIHPLPGFQDSTYIKGEELTFDRKISAKLQFENLLTTSGYQLMKKNNPTLAQKVTEELENELKACVDDFDKEINFQHSMVLLMGAK
eukprot:TRINITY_DN13344_c0_g1_i1.p1 TRINITY_DN13344_c0_g1~~TRINITY_DN13344_c0_g1_i1.p1  ORF type:complete len:281 (+),score=75.11 TRINITY_DN13344_c0_g1_i1:48-890(+)